MTTVERTAAAAGDSEDGVVDGAVGSGIRSGVWGELTAEA